MKVALDTTYVLGRGAVKDTYNLLADGIVKLMRGLCELEGRTWSSGRRRRDTGGMLVPA